MFHGGMGTVGVSGFRYVDTLLAPGGYAITNLPADTNYWVWAYIVSGGVKCTDLRRFGMSMGFPAFFDLFQAGSIRSFIR